MAIVLEGDGTITGVTTFTTPLDDISFDSINVTGIVTATTFQVGTGVSISAPRSQTLALFTNNVEAFHIDDAGRVGIGTTNANKAADTNNTKVVNAGIITANTLYDNYIKHPDSTFTIDVNSAERLRITEQGRLLINHSSSTSTGGLAAFLQVQGTTAGSSAASVVRNSNDNQGPFLSLAKSRGTSNGATTVIQDDDALGVIRFSGADGTDLQSWGAQIAAFVDGTPGANDMPGRLVFGTTVDGANGTSEMMRITSRGTVGIGTIASGGQKLQVYHSSVNELGLFMSGDAISCIGFQDSTTTANRPQIGGKTDDIFIQTGGSEKVRVDSTGHVGINTSTLSSTGLYVINDTSIVAKFARGSGSGEWAKVDIMAGTGTGNSILTFSDPLETERGQINYEHDGDTMRFGTAGTADRVVIDSSGNLLVGHISAVGSGKFQVFTKDDDAIDILSFASANSAGGRLTFYRNKNTTYGSNTKLAINDQLGRIDFRGMNTEGTDNYEIGASIRAEVDGTPGSGTDASDMPGRLMVFTTPDGSDSPTERMRITSDGKIAITGAALSSALCGEGGVDICARGFTGQPALVVGSDSQGNNSITRANNTQKDCRIGMPHYDNSEGCVGLINGFASESHNAVYIGGGTSYLNAATKVSLYTAADTTTTTGTERFRVNANGDCVVVTGDIVFETGNKGIVLGATTNVGNSNTLDDYEEGSFTPAYGPSITATYDQQHGDYVKIGKLVTCWVRLRTDSVSGGNDSNNLRIDSLPFTQVTNSNTGGGHIIYSAYWIADKAPKIGHIVTNTAYMNLYNFSAADEDASILKTDALNTGANDNDSRWVITYFTAT